MSVTDIFCFWDVFSKNLSSQDSEQAIDAISQSFKNLTQLLPEPEQKK